MKILIAEDEPLDRLLLQTILGNQGYDLISCADGGEAWEVLRQGDAPPLAILDWMMPCMDGTEVCRRFREQFPSNPLYVILVTIKDRRDDVVTGLRAGVDDYVTKPFEAREILARVNVGLRTLELQKILDDHASENSRLEILRQTALAMAHHIRNTITPILGMAELYSEDRPKSGEALKRQALKGGYRIAAIIDALVEMSDSREIPTIRYAGDESRLMLDLEPLIERYIKKFSGEGKIP